MKMPGPPCIIVATRFIQYTRSGFVNQGKSLWFVAKYVELSIYKIIGMAADHSQAAQTG
jgi:hypothetical protein